MEPTGQTSLGRDQGIPAAVTTPDRVETSIGTPHYTDGMPSEDTLEKVYDHLDFTHAFEAFVNALGGVNTHAIHRGLLDAGVKDNELLILALLDSTALVLTGNTDTVYVAGILDLSGGPLVVEAPPRLLGALNDYWARWVIDVGGPGPDRGLGGRYLIVPPGYDGPLPEGGFYVARPRTLHVLLFGRLFLQDGDTALAVEAVRTLMKVYPYQAGGVGTSRRADEAHPHRGGRGRQRHRAQSPHAPARPGLVLLPGLRLDAARAEPAGAEPEQQSMVQPAG